MSAVSFDSMVLIYAGVAPSNHITPAPDFNELKTRSLMLLHDISEKQTACILSAIVLSELLVHVPQGKTGQFSVEFSTQFIVAPFDLRASSIAAELWSKYKVEKAKSQGGLPKADRSVLRADCLIVASVRAMGVTDFYSHDKNCRAFARLAGMNAHDLPEIEKSMVGKWMAADINAGLDLPAPTKPMKGDRPKRKKKRPRQ
ncbi:MAG TPA: hypothetical protein VHC22_34070 [Pirellulales bacterium]|nr:hypothetical protein [Pirellulales bacterium]